MISRDFGLWMRDRRMERHWNQSRLADKVGVHLNTIIRWECGQQFPPLDKAEEIAKILGSELSLV